jgi:hypothetical protein
MHVEYVAILQVRICYGAALIINIGSAISQ